MSETTYEYDDAGRLARAVTTTEPEWTDADRGLLLAVRAERDDMCPMCGHPKSECRDPKTARHWEVITEVCQPSRVAQAVAEDVQSEGRRGVEIKTRRTN